MFEPDTCPRTPLGGAPEAPIGTPSTRELPAVRCGDKRAAEMATARASRHSCGRQGSGRMFSAVTRIEIRLPTVAEYLSLRRAVDWKLPSAEEAQDGLASTATGAVAVADGGVVVGLGRVVGDGTFYNFVVDLMVTPKEQGRGVGRQLLAALEREVATRSATGVLQLVADEPVAPFYVHHGYKRSDSNLLMKRLR